MFKTLFFTLLLLWHITLRAEVSVRWFGVASFVLEDGESCIFFDPMFTRASLWNWLGLTELKSNPDEVKKYLDEAGILKLDGVFASHSHFDHVVDAPMVAKLSGAIFYVDESSEIIALAYKDPTIVTKRISDGAVTTIGKFKITTIGRTHAPIRSLGNIEFLPWKVSADFDFGFYDYHLGDTWSYLIEHPEGIILMDQGSTPFVDELKKYTSKVDAVVQGIANRQSDEDVIMGYPSAFSPKVFVPSHFDNFIFNGPKDNSELPKTNVKELRDGLLKSRPEMMVVIPRYNEKIVLLEGK